MKDSKGVMHSNCFINEKTNKEWCFIDHFGITWDYCSRGDFKIYSQMLIKNIQNTQNTEEKKNKPNSTDNEFCLFSLKNIGSKVFSINCEILLKQKKLNPNIVHENNFLWFWVNGGQIKNSIQMCVAPVDTSIISESSNKIEYFGYLELKQCLSDDEMSLTVINVLILEKTKMEDRRKW